MSSFFTLTTSPSDYISYSLESKLNYLREISKNITYNDELRSKVLSNHFHSIILQDLPNNHNQTYVRLFFMFLHNSIPFESKDQLGIFTDIFIININILSDLVFNLYPADHKLHKFLLGIIYKLFVHNSIILKEKLYQNNLLEFYIKFSSLLPYHIDPGKMNEDKDLMEINDWIHIIYENLLQNDNIITDDDTFLISLLKCDNLVFIEIVRDIVDHGKESKVLLISIKNISFLIEMFIDKLNQLSEAIKPNTFTLDNYSIYDEDQMLLHHNRRILCLVDIFSVILTTEDLNKSDYTKAIQSKLARDDLYNQLLGLFRATDDVYDKVYNRNKASKGNEANLGIKISQSSLLYCFQTNLMKFLSNFAYENVHIKQYFINHHTDFYYLLNHMKIDHCNPFKKEWCVLLIKSLCDKCIKIQTMIAELKPVEMDPLLKDYVINKGTHVQMGPNKQQKEFNFDLLSKK